MSSTTATNLQQDLPQQRLLTPGGWLWLAVLGALFIALFAAVFKRTFMVITDNPPSNHPDTVLAGLVNLLHARFNADWSHGLVLPLIGAYYINQNRQRLLQARPRLCWLGLLLFFQGMISCAWWMVGSAANGMLQGYSVILSLFGLTLFLLGPRMMRVLWFPIVFLALAVPVSQRYWEAIAWQLQRVASHLATVALNLVGLVLGLDASVDGSTITLFHNSQYLNKLNVDEACSGLRMLMAFIALGTAVAFLSERAAWQRWVLVALTVPVAVAVNVGRVTLMGVLQLVNPKLAQGDTHLFLGMLMLIPALGLFLLLGWILDRIVVHDNMQGSSSSDPGPSARAQAIPETPPAPPPPRARVLAALVVALVAVNFLLLLGLFQAQKNADFLFQFLGNWQLPVYAACWGLLLIGSWTLAWRLDALAQRGGAPPAAAATPWRLTGRGAALGAALAALVVLSYGLLLASFRPEELSLGLLNRSRAIVLLMASLIGLAMTAWAILRAVSARRLGRVAPAALTRGLTIGVLAAAVLGVQGVLWANGVVVFKQRVDLRRELWEGIPKELPGWHRVREEGDLPREVLEALGTRNYINWVYRDMSRPADDASAVVSLHVTYYTGAVDTVPHVPWRCWQAGGMRPDNITYCTVALRGPEYQPGPHGGWMAQYRESPEGAGKTANVYVPTDALNRLTASIFTFEPPPPERKSNVVYFFVANGKFLKSPEDVRLHGFDPSDRYSYYAKVEVMLHNIADQGEAAARASAFLSAMLPRIMGCLPDWEALQKAPAGAEHPTTAPAAMDLRR